MFLVGMARRAVRRFHLFRCQNGLVIASACAAKCADFVSEDLADPENPHEFSYALGLYPVAILSTARVEQFERRGVSRHDYLRVATFHELGHIFGLVNRTRNVSPPGNPIEENHCFGESGRCAMQQGDCGNLDAAVQISEVLKKTRWLCDDCLTEV